MNRLKNLKNTNKKPYTANRNIVRWSKLKESEPKRDVPLNESWSKLKATVDELYAKVTIMMIVAKLSESKADLVLQEKSKIARPVVFITFERNLQKPKEQS